MGDGTILEANRPQLVSIEVPLPRLAESWDGFRIAQLSDLHYDDYFSVVPLRKAIDIIQAPAAGPGGVDRGFRYLAVEENARPQCAPGRESAGAGH